MAKRSDPRRIVPPSEEQSRWEKPALLKHLRTLREPVDALNREIVRWTIGKTFTPKEIRRGPFVEIGAGSGQLREWLSPEIKPQVLHTEPSLRYARLFQETHPLANFMRCRSERLPCESESQEGVLGLCVLDSVTDLTATQREIHRVLKPGGKLLHFLDLGSNVVQLFVRLVSQNLLPLPNFLRESEKIDTASFPRLHPLPKLSPEDDLLLADLDQVQNLLMILTQHRHPAASVLLPYVRLFLEEPVSTAAAADAFLRLTADPAQLARFNQHLLAVYLAVPREDSGVLGPFEVRPMASTREFEGVLSRMFSTSAGFEVERCELVAARETVKRLPHQPASCRYISHCAGRSLFATRFPSKSSGRLIYESPQATEWLQAPQLSPTDGILQESAMLVFTARKQS